MAHNVEIKVYLLAKSRLEQTVDPINWLADLGVGDVARDRILNTTRRPTKEQNKTDAEIIVEAAGRRCYKSFEPGLNANVTRIREDIKVYIDNILAVGHGSVIEHVSFSFAIENVSRVFTGEMNRHRAGTAISEGSMRYIRYEDIPWWCPTSIAPDRSDTPELAAKKERSRSCFARAFEHAQSHYSSLQAIWKEELAPESKFKAKKEITSMMRRIIPMGVATGGIWTGNLRALRHIFEKRTESAAEEEIFLVATKMLDIMRKEEPNFFGDFVTDESGYSKPKYSKV